MSKASGTTGLKELHQPVMPMQVLNGLSVKREGKFVDATYGRGGHSSLLLEHLNNKGRLLVIDRDPQAVSAARERHGADSRVLVSEACFADLGEALRAHAWTHVDGVLMDLGVSSPQLDQAERGFSFMQDGPLDMRMSPDHGVSAAEWLNSADVKAIAQVLRDYGEERQAKRIAAAIVQQRNQQPLQTTGQLAELISQVLGPAARKHNKHPATRSFQAIRIHINDELGQLRTGLNAAMQALAIGGRLAVISFHSLEDRIVKRAFKAVSNKPSVNRRLPMPDVPEPEFRDHGKQLPGAEEIASNPRSRSAVLRVLERIRLPENCIEHGTGNPGVIA